MAEEEKTPLLVNVEEVNVEPFREFDGPRQQIRNLFESDKVLGSSGRFVDRDEDRINLSASNSFQNLSELDYIVAIFVVAFDTRSGRYNG